MLFAKSGNSSYDEDERSLSHIRRTAINYRIMSQPRSNMEYKYVYEYIVTQHEQLNLYLRHKVTFHRLIFKKLVAPATENEIRAPCRAALLLV
jgi:hypothetical protein